MTPEFGFTFAAIVSVYPAEELGICLMYTTKGHSVSPVLGESMLFGQGLETIVADGQLHLDVCLDVCAVVVP